MNQPSLFPTPPSQLSTTPAVRLVRRTDPDTSRLAADAASRRSPSQRSRVWTTLLELGEATDYELSIACQILRTSAAKRRQELVDAGLVEDSGRRRDTDTGSSAIVWRPCLSGPF